MTAIVNQLTAARSRSGIAATALARLTGTNATNIYAIEHGRRVPRADSVDRLARSLGGSVLYVDTGNRATAADSAASIAECVRSGDDEAAYRDWLQLGNWLASADPTTAVVLTYEPAAPISPEWDAAVAGLVEWRLTGLGAPVPTWVTETPGLTDAHWEPWPAIRGIVEPIVDDVPEPLRRRGIFVEEGELSFA